MRKRYSLPGLEVSKDLSTQPNPVNRAFQYAWYNTKFHLPGEYNAENAAASAIVMSCVNWLWRALRAAKLNVYQGDSDTPMRDSGRILEPILEPNARHTYSNMLFQTIRDLIIAGEVVNEILDSNSTQVITWEAIVQQLPTDTGVAIKYNLQTLSGTRQVELTDVSKMIWQPHPDHAYLGVSPLRAANAELLLDRYAREATAGRLQSPVVGLLLQPKEVDGAVLPQSDLDALSEEVDKIKGTGIGDTFVGEARYEYKELQGVAHRFDYSLIYSLCEARICGLLGIPPAVAQMGAGLAQTKVGATLREEIRLAYQNAAIPVAEIIAEGWSKMLLPAMGRPGYRIEFELDYDHMTEADKYTRWKRYNEMLQIPNLTEDIRSDILEAMRELV